MKNKFIGAFLIGVLATAPLATNIAIASENQAHKTVYSVRSKELQAALNKIQHITKSLKTNYLGLKNQATWEMYIKEARELISKIPDLERLQRENLKIEVDKDEALVKALARINHVEKSITPKEEGGYGNYLGIKNAETWNEYLNLADEYLEKVDKSIFEKQYNELVSRKEKVFEIVNKIENDFKIEYEKAVKLFEEAKKSNDLDKLNEALKEAEKLGTCERSDRLEEDIKSYINNSNNEESKVVFKDKVLDKIVRKAIGKSTGEIYKKDVEGIKALNCEGYDSFENENYVPIYDISGIENLVNLEELDLSANKVSDITPLKGLTKLKYLHLDYNKVNNIEPLKGLRNLEVLSLYNTLISDITPLKNMINLQDVVLDFNKISDITPLKNLKSLRHLSLNCNEVKEVKSLQNLVKLYTLSLSHNQIKDISPLKFLSELYTINIGNNEITDFSVLDELPNLEIINKENTDSKPNP